jgi:hypothetical protein
MISGSSLLSCRDERCDARACSGSRRLRQAVAGQDVGSAQRIGQPVPAGHLPDKAGSVGAGHPDGGDLQRPG